MSRIQVFQNSNQCGYSKIAIAQKTSYTIATFGEWIGFWHKKKSLQNFDYETWYLEITI